MTPDMPITPHVLNLTEVDRRLAASVGGKAANLGELVRTPDTTVPDGFCVTTEAYRSFSASVPELDGLLDSISALDPGNREAIGTQSAAIRKSIEAAQVPEDIVAAIRAALGQLGDHTACAVRSSATAEDSPTASFAGLQDTYLNVTGPTAILDAVRRCWASLFTERAVTYRLRSGTHHRQAQMAVVVQRMVAPEASGVLFTADPLTSNRRVSSVEAIFGLGEALVSGTVSPDSFTVRDGRILTREISTKPRAIRANPAGGTLQADIETNQQDEPALTDSQVLALVELGRRIEAHFESPQDIEWCLVDGDFQIVQSRPITTLFPIPAAEDNQNRVYVSVGHQQMMTDAMKPLGLSVWQLTSRAPMRHAGGRLFVDVTTPLQSPAARDGLIGALSRSDPLIGDALRTVVERPDFVPLIPDEPPAPGAGPPPTPAGGTPEPIDADPAIVERLIAANEDSVAALSEAIQTKSGPELFEFILEDLEELRRLLFDPQSFGVFNTAMDASFWLNDHMQEWLGETNAADTLTQSVPTNVTSEMGLALLDVADAIRPHPEVVAFLRGVDQDGFLEELPGFEGGTLVRDAIVGYLERYGMRCVGEIDITRPRWSERPATLLPLLLANVDNFHAGAGARLFEQGLQEATDKERELLERLHQLPGGDQKAAETKAMIDRVRTFIGYREYPKYGMVYRYFIYKQALLAEATRLVDSGSLNETEDIFFLTFEELHDLARTGAADQELIEGRKAEFESFRNLRPPRVLTSEGEALAGAYRRDDLPEGALAGLAVSSGTVEGRARVITEMATAFVEPGDILVTAHTDPGWSPLFVTIAALVTEVGGTMTHGAVVAREYGLPAVVGVENATERITDGTRIRVNGTDGFVEILPAD